MKKIQVHHNLRKQDLARITLGFLFLGSFLLVYHGFTIAYGVEVFSKDEQPFGIPYEEWIGKYWKWLITLTPEQSEPLNGSCLINKTNSTVMLLNSAVGGKRELECDITSKDGILIPSWHGFLENNNKDDIPDNTPVNLSKLAKEQVNLGAVSSVVKVDGKSVAKLDEVTSMSPDNKLSYKINTMDNFTEIYAKPFNIKIPENTFLPDQVVGTWPAGAQGWFTFLKPLPAGDHKVSYTLSVQGLGADNVAAETTYTLHVK